MCFVAADGAAASAPNGDTPAELVGSGPEPPLVCDHGSAAAALILKSFPNGSESSKPPASPENGSKSFLSPAGKPPGFFFLLDDFFLPGAVAGIPVDTHQNVNGALMCDDDGLAMLQFLKGIKETYRCQRNHLRRRNLCWVPKMDRNDCCVPYPYPYSVFSF